MWIGWQFDFNAGLISLHPDKKNKLLQLIADLKKHKKVSKKTLERFIGLNMWCSALFPLIRVHMHWLYADLFSPPATLFSCSPADWTSVRDSLSDDLIFVRTPPRTAIPRHQNVAHKSQLSGISITERRIWMRIQTGNSPSRKLSLDSLTLWNSGFALDVCLSPCDPDCNLQLR